MQLAPGVPVVQMPDSGCCGMAGSFGFLTEKYEVSLACGERVLLPAVRALAPDALIVADGFSCGEQISQSGARQALRQKEREHHSEHGHASA